MKGIFKDKQNKQPRRVFHFRHLLPFISSSRFSERPLPAPVQSYLYGMLRHSVFERDQGVCRKCGRATIALHEAITWFAEHRLDGMVTVSSFRVAIGKAANRWPRQLWDMDHIKPLMLGGEPLDPKNLRTLCLECHINVTTAMRWGAKVGFSKSEIELMEGLDEQRTPSGGA